MHLEKHLTHGFLSGPCLIICLVVFALSHSCLFTSQCALKITCLMVFYQALLFHHLFGCLYSLLVLSLCFTMHLEKHLIHGFLSLLFACLVSLLHNVLSRSLVLLFAVRPLSHPLCSCFCSLFVLPLYFKMCFKDHLFYCLLSGPCLIIYAAVFALCSSCPFASKCALKITYFIVCCQALLFHHLLGCLCFLLVPLLHNVPSISFFCRLNRL